MSEVFLCKLNYIKSSYSFVVGVERDSQRDFQPRNFFVNFSLTVLVTISLRYIQMPVHCVQSVCLGFEKWLLTSQESQVLAAGWDSYNETLNRLKCCKKGGKSGYSVLLGKLKFT